MTNENPPPPAPISESANTGPALDPRVAELDDQLLRLRADFDNFRRRTAKERQEWTQRCLEGILGDLVASLDHFEIGLSTAEKNNAPASVLDGFRMVQQQLESVTRKYGLERINALGATFDPRLHEALQTIPSADVPAQQVITQLRPGYRLGEKLVRAAQVLVSGGPATDAQPETGA
jgi:molecular chaperone GrpE